MTKVLQIGSQPGDRPKKRRQSPKLPPEPASAALPEAAEVGTDEDYAAAAAKSQTTARAAVAMKISGASYVEIAEELGYVTPQSARIAVEELIASAYDENTDYKSLRNIASARLEKLMRSLAPTALDPNDPDHLPYARQFLSVIDRHIKLHGIDAPQVVTVVNPDADEFERVVGALAQQALAQGPQEADVVLFEQVDGDEQVVWAEEDDDDEEYDDD